MLASVSVQTLPKSPFKEIQCLLPENLILCGGGRCWLRRQSSEVSRVGLQVLEACRARVSGMHTERLQIGTLLGSAASKGRP